ncbi:hypothetical protein LY76DRAFT_592378 [Colletotrichum caudatum]|nr:hypothetical protein LY76DRAFT_592378 [Colletotrichum caudatum]
MPRQSLARVRQAPDRSRYDTVTARRLRGANSTLRPPFFLFRHGLESTQLKLPLVRRLSTPCWLQNPGHVEPPPLPVSPNTISLSLCL